MKFKIVSSGPHTLYNGTIWWSWTLYFGSALIAHYPDWDGTRDLFRLYLESAKSGDLQAFLRKNGYQL